MKITTVILLFSFVLTNQIAIDYQLKFYAGPESLLHAQGKNFIGRILSAFRSRELSVADRPLSLKL